MTDRIDQLSERARWFLNNFDEIDLADICASQEASNQARQDSIDRVRKIHHPASDWSWKPLGCQHNGAHTAPCRGCHGQCWPCPTIRALDEQQSTSTQNDGPSVAECAEADRHWPPD